MTRFVTQSHKVRRRCARRCSRPTRVPTSRSSEATAAGCGTTRAASTSTSSRGSPSSVSVTARRHRSPPRGSSSTVSGTRRTCTGPSRCCGLPALLAERFEGGRAFFCNSGAEANEAALKIARKATGQDADRRARGRLPRPDARRALGHGPAVEMGGVRPARARRLVRPAERRRVARGGARARRRHGAPAARARARRGRRDPARARVRTGGRRARARDRCAALRRRGAGRDGPDGHVLRLRAARDPPDLVTLAKGLANGLPMGALLAGERAAPGFVPGDHGSTFGGNPVAAAAAVAVVEAIDDDLLAHVRERGAQLAAGLEALPAVRAVRGRGPARRRRARPSRRPGRRCLPRRGAARPLGRAGCAAADAAARRRPPTRSRRRSR